MSNLKFGPKIVPLSEVETLSSIERWRQNILYHLRLNEEFRQYLKEDTEFGKKSKQQPCRLFRDTLQTRKDNEGHDVVSVKESKEDKCFIIDLLLDQIANFAPLIPRFDITRESASLQEVWQKVRLYHNLQKSGALMNEIWNMSRKDDELPQALFARLKQCYDDNLITARGLHHVDGVLIEDEEMSPTLYNSVILHWLQLLHPKLRDAVTQRFSCQLRDNTYGALFPEISSAVGSLLEELNGDTATNRVYSSQSSRPYTPFKGKSSFKPSARGYNKKSCEYCKVTGKKAYYTHTIEECLFIKRENRKNHDAAKQVECSLQESDYLQEQYEEYYQLTGERCDQEASRVIEHVLSVSSSASPVLELTKGDKTYSFVLDTGCTAYGIVGEETVASLESVITPTSQRARTADGQLMKIIGETEAVLYRNNKPYHLRALVCSDKTDLLVGMPFMKTNDVAIRPATDEIIIDGKEFLKYSPVRKMRHSKANRVTQFTVQSPTRQVILPGESCKFSVQGVIGDRDNIVIEPRWDSHINRKAGKDSELWPRPQIVSVHSGAVSLVNDLSEPIIVRRTEHIAQIQPQVEPEVKNIMEYKSVCKPEVPIKKISDYSANIILNPDKVLSLSEEDSFKSVLKTYDEVFNPKISTYNGKMGACFVEVNMGESLPPQRKGRVPFYSRDNLQELQDKFDDLEQKGVFSRPQDIGVTIENTNPSFLVNKQQSSEKRLVTDFSQITDYCRPTPTLLPDVDSTLRKIGTWKYIIKSDMSAAYHQIPLKKASKRFCGVHTPYKGLRVYNVGCMGLPGVEVALEELTCLLLGDLVQAGVVAKLADDILIGGDTPEDLKENFVQVLHRLLESNIKLSSTKTTIAPKSINILGWIWSSGQLKASPHRLTALSTCSPPETVTAMRSYTGTYRFLSRVLSGYAKLLAPLEAATRGKSGKETIYWSEDLHIAFRKTQEALQDAKTITVPLPSDVLWIVTDAAVRPSAIGATLYVVRDKKPLLAGFFNAKLPEFQSRWLPCEREGLAVAAALNHYAPYIIQSQEKPQVMTDSKAVVQAVAKLRRGEFSASSRLTAFLSSVSRYSAQIQHISGAVNLPADYASRHPLECKSPETCHVCKFISDTANEVVNEVSVLDFIEGKVKLPFTNRSAWTEVQAECPDLRKVLSHMKRGTVPSRKSKNLRVVRKYLSSNLLVSSDGLLIHRVAQPLLKVDQIVVPQNVIDGILTALHLKLQHPTAYQLMKAFSRYFFTLKLEKSVSAVSKSCHQCTSIKDVPKSLISQSSSEPPSHVGVNFAADVIKRYKQKILVIRETTTSYTLAEQITSETIPDITSALIKLCFLLKPSKISSIKIRLDPAPAHQSMFKNIAKDSALAKNNIMLELGRSVNPNKNATIDKAIRELHRELVSIKPSGGPVSSIELSEAIANLNSRIRVTGMSAHEHWTQRDQVTNEQLPIVDRDMIMKQYQRRIDNHHSSEVSKAPGKCPLPSPKVKVGSLVYIYSDRDKSAARQRYLVTEVNDEGLHKLRKFTSNLFQSKIYEVKPNEIFMVPQFYKDPLPNITDDESSDEDLFEEALTDLKKESTSAEHSSDTSSDEDSDHIHEKDEESQIDDDDSETPLSSDSEDEEGDVLVPVRPPVENSPQPAVPPVELTTPAENTNAEIHSRLRIRKKIDYNED